MNADEKDQLLDRYVSGEPMSASEEAQVDHLLEADAEFRAEYRVRQALFEAGKRERHAAWETRQQTRPATPKPTIFPMRWAAAASVMLLLGAGLIWWLRTPTNQPLTGQTPLYEQREEQLNLLTDDSLAVGTVAWVLTKAPADEYEFEQTDTLRLFSPDPTRWATQPWRLTRLSEVRYQLRVGKQMYILEQGLRQRLPLTPAQQVR